MQNGLISWLLNNYENQVNNIDRLLGAMAFLERSDSGIKVTGANTEFEKLLGWTGFQWQMGMDMEHLLAPQFSSQFTELVDMAGENMMVEHHGDVRFKNRVGNVLRCHLHIICINVHDNHSEYVIRFSYNKQAQIKDALFTEALRQSRTNCWYWDMNQGMVTFFNTDISEAPDNEIVFMNEETISFSNFPQGFVDKLNFAGSYRNQFMDFVKKILSRGQSSDLTVDVALEAGSRKIIWVNFTGHIVRDDKNIPEYVMGTWKNITAQKADQQRQQHNSSIIGALVQDSIYDITVNLEKNFFVADKSMETWLEETRVTSPYCDQAIRELAVNHVVKEHRQRFLDFFNLERIRKLPEDKNFSIEYQRTFKGKVKWFKATINTFCMDEFSDKWMYALVYDIDESKQKELVLEKMAATDALTGLLNRAHSLKSMRQHIEANPDMPAAVMYMDLDNFKSVNDTLGHAAGDSLLICVANAMKSYFGDDAISGRIGGDEFIMMYLNADKSYVSTMMTDFVNYVGSKCQEECPGVHVTASLGYALYPDYGNDIAILADFADKALYQAKHHGKNMAIEYVE